MAPVLNVIHVDLRRAAVEIALGPHGKSLSIDYMALPCGTGNGKDITFEYGLKYAALLRGDVCVYQA